MTERRTSAAKDILTPRETALLDNYGIARNHFEHARDPLISQQHIDNAAEKARQDRLADRGSILDGNSRRLPQVEFEQQNSESGQGETSGSKMVKDDQPKLENRPPPELAKDSDREAFKEKWLQEQQRAREQDNDRSRDVNRDYER